MLITDEVNVKLEADGDIPADGDLEMNTGLDAICAAARSEILAIAGEWFDNLTQGVKWWETRLADGTVIVDRAEAILGSRFDHDRVMAELRGACARVEGVLKVKSAIITFDQKTRTVDASFILSTIFGDTPTQRMPNLGGRS